jgi:hypothetical protein
MKTKYTKNIITLILAMAVAFVATLAVMALTRTAEAGSGRLACTNAPQVGIMEMQFNDADYALQAINFAPVCSGQAAVFGTSWGDYGPDETVTAKALGSNFGAVSLQLPDMYTGTANVSWMVIPTTQ